MGGGEAEIVGKDISIGFGDDGTHEAAGRREGDPPTGLGLQLLVSCWMTTFA